MLYEVITKHLDYIYIPILDKRGNVIKFLEIFSDMTAIRSMVKYLEQSVDIVQKNISSLAKGDMTFANTVLDADEHSASARIQFEKIGEAMNTARQAIAKLVTDSNSLANAAIAGNMKYRSDPSIHEGDYRTIIEGMNNTFVITSYSIHYTKLYENCCFRSFSHVMRLRMVSSPAGLNAWAAICVITSYSIHYTKLYDHIVSKGIAPSR